MSVVLAIKRSQSANTPGSLANGEMAYSFSSDRMFIGQTDTIGSAVTLEYIGGKLLVDKVANLESVLFSDGGTQNYTSIGITDRATINKLVLSNFTENGILYTNGTGDVVQVAGTVGKVMQVAANGAPTFEDLNGGVY
jgi:hypothetical protein|tara:strand:+ start:314 stop:727 length:414 start_codon:yes stop_codon:yes gene_type:complete